MSQRDASSDIVARASAGSGVARTVRQAVMAGRFYPTGAEACRRQAELFLQPSSAANDAGRRPIGDQGWLGAVVPHAGWICSGALAGLSIATLAGSRHQSPDVVVIFAAIHSAMPARRTMLCSADAWQTPLGEARVRGDLQAELLSAGDLFEIDDDFHVREHAVEVELPLVQAAWPDATILPAEVPPDLRASKVGRAVAQAVERLRLSAVYLASSDLTHYGPMYDFAPAGIGPGGLAWAKQNDRVLLERVEALAVDDIVPVAINDHSACGPGAIAAMLSACMQQGARRGRVLQHANSFETLADVHPQPPTDAVGYAAVVVG
jgi:AmmeMemoRadiSam system protein B